MEVVAAAKTISTTPAIVPRRPLFSLQASTLLQINSSLTTVMEIDNIKQRARLIIRGIRQGTTTIDNMVETSAVVARVTAGPKVEHLPEGLVGIITIVREEATIIIITIIIIIGAITI